MLQRSTRMVVLWFHFSVQRSAPGHVTRYRLQSPGPRRYRYRSAVSLLRVHSNNEKTAARVGKPSGAKSLCRMAIPSRGFAPQRSCRGDLQYMEHDMATSEPVKTILVVDLTHVPNDPLATTILGDLRARLIRPTRVGEPNGQPPESSHLLARPARSDHRSERAGVFIGYSVVVLRLGAVDRK